MANHEFPPNSEASKREIPFEGKNIEQVTTSEVRRRRKPLRRQFVDTFVAGDMKSTRNYVVMDIVIPALKDMILDAWYQGMQKMMFGESRRRGGYSPQTGSLGHVAYHRVTSAMGHHLPGPQRAMSREARAGHNFDEIVLESRTDAEQVIDKLFDVVSQYGTASVSDLYELLGLPTTHTDNKWGWSVLKGAGVSRVRGGYLLDLPDPHPLD